MNGRGRTTTTRVASGLVAVSSARLGFEGFHTVLGLLYTRSHPPGLAALSSRILITSSTSSLQVDSSHTLSPACNSQCTLANDGRPRPDPCRRDPDVERVEHCSAHPRGTGERGRPRDVQAAGTVCARHTGALASESYAQSMRVSCDHIGTSVFSLRVHS